MNKIKDIVVDDEMRHHANKSIARRSIVGGFIYLIIWFSIVIPHKFYATTPEFSFWFTLIFVTMAVARLVLIANFNIVYGRNPILWKGLFFPIVWLPALTWGVLCAIALVNPSFDRLSLAIFISTAGLVGGGVAALIPSRILTVGLISAYLVPGAMTLLYWDARDPSVHIVFFIFWVGMLFVTRTQHREYWVNLKQSFLIKKHAAELELLNTLDGLTGLKNRKCFDELLIKELKRSIRTQSDISLLFIDVDHFKNVNDQHGHLVGDECLRKISRLLQDQVKRETDTIARYGGEEFAIILADTTREQAFEIGQVIRKNVESLDIQYGHLAVSLTVSIGISSCVPQPGCKGEVLIELSDSALYRAKHNGRNQVCY